MARPPFRGGLDSRQAFVLGQIYRLVDRHGLAEGHYVGCRGTCARLTLNGFIETEVRAGPRGGERYRYRLTAAGKDWNERRLAHEQELLERDERELSELLRRKP